MNRADRRSAIASARCSARSGWTPWEDMRERVVAARDAYNLPGLETAWRNNVYSVQRYRQATEWGDVVHLMVRRHDAAPVRSWPDMQRIKDELVGPERVAVEVYPARSALVDDANIYHLWILPVGRELPFGLGGRCA